MSLHVHMAGSCRGSYFSMTRFLILKSWTGREFVATHPLPISSWFPFGSLLFTFLICRCCPAFLSAKNFSCEETKDCYLPFKKGTAPVKCLLAKFGHFSGTVFWGRWLKSLTRPWSKGFAMTPAITALSQTLPPSQLRWIDSPMDGCFVMGGQRGVENNGPVIIFLVSCRLEVLRTIWNVAGVFGSFQKFLCGWNDHNLRQTDPQYSEFLGVKLDSGKLASLWASRDLERYAAMKDHVSDQIWCWAQEHAKMTCAVPAGAVTARLSLRMVIFRVWAVKEGLPANVWRPHRLCQETSYATVAGLVSNPLLTSKTLSLHNTSSTALETKHARQLPLPFLELLGVRIHRCFSKRFTGMSRLSQWFQLTVQYLLNMPCEVQM